MHDDWSIALSRKLPSVVKRLRTIVATPDGRLFLATDAVVSSLHCAAALNLSRSARPPSPFSSFLRAVPSSPRGGSSPAVGHQFVCVNQQQQLRKDTSLNFTDVVSLAVLHCGFVAVVFGDGAFHLFGSRAERGDEGGWGGAWAAWLHFPLLIAPPSVDVNCVCTATVLAPSPPDVQSTLTPFRLLVVARESGVFVYDEDFLKSAHSEPVPHLACLTTAWSNVMASCDTVQVPAGAPHITLIAVAHEHGKLVVHALSAASESAELRLNQSVLWHSDLSAPISSLSFCTTSARKSTICLAIAVGNDLVLVEWGDGCALQCDDQWKHPTVSRVPQAHELLLSAAHIMADGSVVSAGMDGSLLRWDIDAAARVQQPQRSLVSCSVVLKQDEDAVEPIMSAATTLNSFCVYVLSTNLRSRTEIGEASKGNIRKYLGSGRRSSISLLTMPLRQNVGAVGEAIEKCIDRFLSVTWIGRGINMWDVGLFVGRYDNVKNGLTQRLRSRYEWLLETHQYVEGGKEKNMKTHERWARVQRAMVLLWLRRVISGSGVSNVDAIDGVQTTSALLVKWLLCMHFDECIAHVLEDGGCTEQFSEMDLKSLESMCAFVWTCSGLTRDASAMRRRATEARRLVAQRTDAVGGSVTTACPVCEGEGEGVRRALEADEERLVVFACSEKDEFARCVKSGVAVTEVVPLHCVGCEARAVTHEFGWIHGGKQCALCKCELVSSSVESV